MNKIVFYVLFKHWNYYFTSDEIRFGLMFGTVLQNGFLDVKCPMSYKLPYKTILRCICLQFSWFIFLSDRKRVLKLPFNCASK